VSTAGGLPAAYDRAAERGCESMQIWGQSPRQWAPGKPKPSDEAAFRELLDSGPVKSVAIHAIYLINCASTDSDLRRKSLGSLTHALRLGDRIGAAGLVLHPGSAKGEPNEEALPRVAEVLREALDESDRCDLLLENTAGAGDTIGRTFEELSELIRLCRGRKRVGVCLDSCHMLASGFDIRTADKLTAVIDDFRLQLGVRAGVLPMSDEPVRTWVKVRARWAAFQEFMIRDRAEGVVEDVAFRGAETAAPTAEVLAAIAGARAVVIGPSNPVISIGPILALPGMREALRSCPGPVVAVSPLVAGRSVKGPTEAFLAWAGQPPSSEGIAAYYDGLLDGLVADERTDALPTLETDVAMTDDAGRRRVAAETLDFALALG